MKQGWVKRVFSLGVLLLSVWQAQADGWIYFSNIIGGVRQYVYQRDGTKAYTPFVAQLCMQFNGNWIAVSPPTAFIQQGTFSAGTVIIPGDYGGRIVTLRVRVWNGALFASYDDALNAGGVTGECEPFAVTLASYPDQQAQGMLGFQSFRLSCDQNRVAQVVYKFNTKEGQSTLIQIPTTQSEASCPANMDAAFMRNFVQFFANQVPGNPPGLSSGTLLGVLSQGQERPPFTYVPNANTYGTDLVYFSICNFCDDFTTHDAVSITIEPSAARNRPTLILSATQKPVLLGLNARKYRIDSSSDLKTWEPAGNVTGNYSTVDLSSFVTAGASAHFLRATDITPP